MLYFKHIYNEQIQGIPTSCVFVAPTKYFQKLNCCSNQTIRTTIFNYKKHCSEIPDTIKIGQYHYGNLILGQTKESVVE